MSARKAYKRKTNKRINQELNKLVGFVKRQENARAKFLANLGNKK